MTDGSGSLPRTTYLIKQLELAVRARLEEVVKPWGVTALQYTALTVLARRSGLTSAELARLSFVTAQTMSDMVGTLQTRGLIRRAQDPAHRRHLRISLTENGERLLAEVRPAVDALEARMLAELAPGEQEALRKGLAACYRSLVSRA